MAGNLGPRRKRDNSPLAPNFDGAPEHLNLRYTVQKKKELAILETEIQSHQIYLHKIFSKHETSSNKRQETQLMLHTSVL